MARPPPAGFFDSARWMSIPPARGAREREAEAREAAAAKLPPPECSLFFRYHTELPPKEGGALSRSPSCQALKGSDLGRSELVVAVKSTQVPSRASLHRSHTLTRSRTSPTLRTDLPFRGAMSHDSRCVATPTIRRSILFASGQPPPRGRDGERSAGRGSGPGVPPRSDQHANGWGSR